MVVIPDRRTPVVTHMLWYRVGAADEPAGKSGIAHFLEHLMFKGTAKNPAGRFSQRLAAIGGQENAFTSYDYTGYFQRVAREHLGAMMEFEADRMTGLVLTEDMIAAERNVILEERNQRIENEPGARLSEQVPAAQYLNHPYHRPTIGWRHEMETLDREDALTFYRRFYTPDNAVLVVAGDVTAEEVKALAEKTYGKIERHGARSAARKRPQEPPQIAERRVTFADVRVTQPSLQRSYLVPSSRPPRTAKTTRSTCWRISSAAARTAGSIVRWSIEKRLATNAGAWYQGTSLDATRFGVYAMPEAGVSLETARGRDRCTRSQRCSTRTDDGRARARQEPHDRGLHLCAGQPVDAGAHVRRGADHRLDGRGRAGAARPAACGDGRAGARCGAAISRQAPVGHRLSDEGRGGARGEEVVSRIFGAAPRPASSALSVVTAAAPPARSSDRQPGGIKAWLVQRTVVPMVAIDYAFRAAPTPIPPTSRASPTCRRLLDEGAGELDARAFQERMEEKAIQLGFSAGRDHFRGSLRTLTENLDEAVNLLRLALTAPRFDAEPVERIRGQMLAQLVTTAPTRTNRQPALVGDGLPRSPLWPPVERHAGIVAAITADDLKDTSATSSRATS